MHALFKVILVIDVSWIADFALQFQFYWFVPLLRPIGKESVADT